MNLLEWRQNPDRRSLALDMLNQPTMREMLAVMEQEHPMRQESKLQDGFAATLAVGESRGFQKALNMIRSFAEEIPTPHENIKVTWGEPTEEELPLPTKR